MRPVWRAHRGKHPLQQSREPEERERRGGEAGRAEQAFAAAAAASDSLARAKPRNRSLDPGAKQKLEDDRSKTWRQQQTVHSF